jgi:hypothetical protein
LKDFAATALTFAANSKALSVFFDLYLLQSLEILFDIGPLKLVTGLVEALLEFFSQHPLAGEATVGFDLVHIHADAIFTDL